MIGYFEDGEREKEERERERERELLPVSMGKNTAENTVVLST